MLIGRPESGDEDDATLAEPLLPMRLRITRCESDSKLEESASYGRSRIRETRGQCGQL